MEQDTFLNRWDLQVRANPALARLHVPDIGRSYPLLAYVHDRLQTRHFYHIGSQTSPNTLYLGAPTVCVILDSESGNLLETFPAAELGIEPFADTQYTLTEAQKATIRPRVARLRSLYDVVVARYPYEPAGVEGQEFWTALRGSVPPPLLPYYEALSPDFVAWCTA